MAQVMETQPEIARNPALIEAWSRFAVYDRNAQKTQRRFMGLRRAILVLGVVATGLAIVHEVFGDVGFQRGDIIIEVIRYLVILTPITVSVLLAGAVKFERGIAWILLRGSAEAVKQEIFKHRARAGIYSLENEKTTNETRDVKLSRKVKSISERLMKTSVNQIGLALYKDDEQLPPLYAAQDKDDGFSDLDPNEYLNWRLEYQRNWYRNKAEQIDKQFQRLQWFIYILGGVGTFLAAIGLEIWIAFTNGIVTAIAAYLELKNLEVTLTQYNQAASDLESIRMWWLALTDSDKSKPKNFEKLVLNTETILKNELSGWVQEMTDVLAELYQKSETGAETT